MAVQIIFTFDSFRTYGVGQDFLLLLQGTYISSGGNCHIHMPYIIERTDIIRTLQQIFLRGEISGWNRIQIHVHIDFLEIVKSVIQHGGCIRESSVGGIQYHCQ